MKKFASIAAVVGLLLAAAIYYGSLNKDRQKPIVDVIDPVVDTTPDTNVTPPQPPSKPTVDATSDGTLKLSSSSSNGYLTVGSDGELYATIDIQAMKYAGAKRPPLNLAIVIDRSGSMAGDKIVQAKNAARRLVDRLDGNDRVAIVSYGSDVKVDFASGPANGANRAQMHYAIDNIVQSGGTNLSGGFERGLTEVMRWGNTGAVNRVILMSDGNANIGVVTSDGLENLSRDALKRGVSVSTIGVGLDYNEDVMTRMANVGAGNYYFVDNSMAIAAAFDKEIKSLSSTVARNTALVISLAEGVELSELYGFPYQQVGDKLMISLAEFYSEQSKNVLLKLKADTRAAGGKKLMDVSLSYTDVVKADGQANQTVALGFDVTDDAKLAETMVNTHVISRVQQVEVAQSMQKAMDAYGSGDSGAAIQILERQQARTRSANKRYGLGKDFDRVDKEIDVMNAEMGRNAPSSAPAKRMVKRKKARSNYIMFDSSSF
jgi:Ca-activated chloride channel family protein